MCSFNRGNAEGINSLKMYVLCYVCEETDFVDRLEERFV